MPILFDFNVFFPIYLNKFGDDPKNKIGLLRKVHIMPGIYGVYNKSPMANKDKTKKIFQSMGEILHHKKLCSHRVYDFDCTLIGKISFSNDPGPCEAVKNSDNSIALYLDGAIFSYNDGNGSHEIDNYKHIFNILLTEYKKTGSIDTRKLNGEFNLVIYDICNRSFLIANDRWGFRELYYYDGYEFFLFAPEVKALLRYDGIKRKIDNHALCDFLNFGYILGNKTFIDGVKLLPPASMLVVDRNGVKIETRDFEYQTTLSANNFNEHVDTAYNLLDKAVERRLRGRNKIASYLSGGLDSRIISAIALNHISKIDAFTLGEKSGNEYAVAKKVAKTLKGCNHFLAKPMPEHIMKYLGWAVWLSDGSLSSLASVSCFLGALADPLKNNDLLLGGFVGDLILGASFTKREEMNGDIPLCKRIEKMKFRVGIRMLRPFVSILFDKEFGKRLNYFAVKSVEEEFERISGPIELFPFQEDIFVILTRCRRGYNINRGLIGHIFIEEYYPFFDNDLFEFLYSLPPQVRLEHKLYIEIYKKYFPDLAKIPWLKTGSSLYNKESSINSRKKILMNSIRWYIKRGTLGKINLKDRNQYAPVNEWYRTNRTFRNFINEILLDGRTIARGYFNEKGIRDLLHKTNRGWDYMPLIGRLCVFELWCRLFLDGEEKILSSGYGFEKDSLNA